MTLGSHPATRPALLGIVLALLAAACGGTVATPSTPHPISTLPSPVQSPVACTPSQLVMGTPFFTGAAGSMGGGVRMWNTSATPCLLEGRPSVEIHDAAGRSLAVDIHPSPEPTPAPFVLPSRQVGPASPDQIVPGIASVSWQWANWCGPAPAQPLSFLLTLPGGGELRATGAVEVPYCDDASKASWLNVGPFVQVPTADAPTTVDPSGIFVPGQPMSGDGWRVLLATHHGWAPPVSSGVSLPGTMFDSNWLDVADAPSSVARLWGFLNVAEAPSLDLNRQVVVALGFLTGEGPVCGQVRLNGVTFDATKRLVAVELQDATAFETLPPASRGIAACAAVGVSTVTVLALDRSHLPPSPFALRLDELPGPRSVETQVALATSAATVPAASTPPVDATLVAVSATHPSMQAEVAMRACGVFDATRGLDRVAGMALVPQARDIPMYVPLTGTDPFSRSSRMLPPS